MVWKVHSNFYQFSNLKQQTVAEYFYVNRKQYPLISRNLQKSVQNMRKTKSTELFGYIKTYNLQFNSEK